MSSTNSRLHGGLAAIAALSALLLMATPAGAATDVYPAGGGTFAGGAEGWQEAEAECSVSLLSTCTASGDYDGSGGSPAGSLAAKTNADLNLLGTFESTVVFDSPEFTVTEAGTATLHLDREFVPGGLIELVPTASYAVTLNDLTETTGSVPLTEEIENASAFTGKDAVATVVAGHTYTISVEVKASSSITLNVLVDGETSVRFDNVRLSVQTPDDPVDPGPDDDGDGGSGEGSTNSSSTTSLTSKELLSSVKSSSQETAQVHVDGKRVFVRVSCPRRVKRACRISAQGIIGKRAKVTRRSSAKVASGRTKLLALRVKPRFRDEVARRKRLLIVQEVRVGKVSTTFARTRVLIRRG